jgi:ABC-type lipoprotein release transport system permease subunit
MPAIRSRVDAQWGGEPRRADAGSATLAMLLTSAAAAVAPVRRALRVDPAIVLRECGG